MNATKRADTGRGPRLHNHGHRPAFRRRGRAVEATSVLPDDLDNATAHWERSSEAVTRLRGTACLGRSVGVGAHSERTPIVSARVNRARSGAGLRRSLEPPPPPKLGQLGVSVLVQMSLARRLLQHHGGSG